MIHRWRNQCTSIPAPASWRDGEETRCSSFGKLSNQAPVCMEFVFSQIKAKFFLVAKADRGAIPNPIMSTSEEGHEGYIMSITSGGVRHMMHPSRGDFEHTMVLNAAIRNIHH